MINVQEFTLRLFSNLFPFINLLLPTNVLICLFLINYFVVNLYIYENFFYEKIFENISILLSSIFNDHH